MYSDCDVVVLSVADVTTLLDLLALPVTIYAKVPSAAIYNFNENGGISHTFIIIALI